MKKYGITDNFIALIVLTATFPIWYFVGMFYVAIRSFMQINWLEKK